jgi:ABC-type sugar transport system substrate-binding protein
MIMKKILSALLALSVLAGVAATSARAADADFPKFGSQGWWNQQESERN